MRWVRPRSITSQSAAEMMRGSRSCGKIRSVAFVAAVDREGDALVEEGQVRLLLAAPQLLGRELEQLLVQPAVGAARLRARVEHLVEDAVDAVAGERISGDDSHGHQDSAHRRHDRRRQR